MDQSLKQHKTQLKSLESPNSESLKDYVERFKSSDLMTLDVNCFSYLLNLHTMNYEFVGKSCKSFTRFKPEDFMEKGMNILPHIMHPHDFKKLSTEIFPEMNVAYQSVRNHLKKNLLFEIYYRLHSPCGNGYIPMVEYSSYVKYDDQDNPTLSAGRCYETALQINGVRGIVRLKTEDEQKILYDRIVLHDLEVLTITELKLAELLATGRSKKEIAKDLNVSIHTVKTHFKNIYKKLDINSAGELINQLRSN